MLATLSPKNKKLSDISSEKSIEDNQHLELKTQAARRKAISSPSTESVPDNNNQTDDNIKPSEEDTQDNESNPEIQKVPKGHKLNKEPENPDNKNEHHMTLAPIA